MLGALPVIGKALTKIKLLEKVAFLVMMASAGKHPNMFNDLTGRFGILKNTMESVKKSIQDLAAAKNASESDRILVETLRFKAAREVNGAIDHLDNAVSLHKGVVKAAEEGMLNETRRKFKAQFDELQESINEIENALKKDKDLGNTSGVKKNFDTLKKKYEGLKKKYEGLEREGVKLE
jgi:predicted  nucleic acid-binding Zn-ribbon protein